MGRIGIPELVFIFLIVVILFGAKKLPEIGNAIGKAIKEFKKAGKELDFPKYSIYPYVLNPDSRLL